MQLRSMNIDMPDIIFSDFDREFGRFLLRSSGISSPELLLTGMLSAFELRAGRTVLEFARYAGKTLLLDDEEKFTLPEADEWMKILSAPEFVPVIAPSYLETESSPLVFIGQGMVMMRRYAALETAVREALLCRKRFHLQCQTRFRKWQ